ncbi:AbrB family transcriptional regulator [Candidatus Rhodobacter oscarellae]|uniref:AbrB family transcriptional regulator n=1 Tax=Candidatus Rhodobacter oscarellae TaxID=1675527 RepID=UPI00136498F7|nr:AbrB family transcriptional regulator [Candidatus Rhodobacter lobularis]
MAKLWPLFGLGALGGLLAYLAGLPMPFMLGAIAGAGAGVMVLEARHGAQDRRMPKPLREAFVSLIGIMIGASFSPELLAVMPGFWPSALAVIGFIAVSQVGGYWIMRGLGGYRPVDALYASMPGGLVEAAILGEQAGADGRLISVQHFIRIILVVFTVPLLFWLYTGAVVGSASGQGFGSASYGWRDVAWVIGLAPVGLALGRLTRLPAGHLMGPLILSAALHALGVVDVSAPPWMLHAAQLVVGVSLGAQFSGLTARVLLRGLGVGVVAVAYMLVVGLGFALALAPWLPASPVTMFLSFAPGGVTEMSLIALSLNTSPVVVSVHHLIRISCAVFVTQWMGRRLVGVAARR